MRLSVVQEEGSALVFKALLHLAPGNPMLVTQLGQDGGCNDQVPHTVIVYTVQGA